MALEGALKASGKEWELNPGDGAFYGPKIDIAVFDALRRRFQCATVQLDFQLPIRFDLAYQNEHNEDERPIIIHRAVLGSVERMFAILTEHYAGKWPYWLSPRQVMIVPISELSLEYAKDVRRRIRKAGHHVEVDASDRSTLIVGTGPVPEVTSTRVPAVISVMSPARAVMSLMRAFFDVPSPTSSIAT